MPSVGRPVKNQALFALLQPEKLYTPATIADLAMNSDLFSQWSDDARGAERRRIRLRFGNMTRNRTQVFGNGDGMIIIPGQSPKRAWYGVRYLLAAGLIDGAMLDRVLRSKRSRRH